MGTVSKTAYEIEDLKKVRARAKEISGQFNDKIAEICRANQEEVSPLTALLWDAFESFNTIYYQLIPALELTPLKNTEALGDLLMDMKLEFQHIAQHIADADESWLQLANSCYQTTDTKEELNERT
ncbi:hypothetical protein IH992_25640 [Candidatus Poribacteria bacterium]|nr:hypothetical protein [Candidatus Poribacteria bacterium]